MAIDLKPIYETPFPAEYIRKYGFPGYIGKEEYDQRFERARKLMAESEIDALLVTSYVNTVYFGGVSGVDIGYVASMEPGLFVVLVPRDSEPVRIIPEIFDRLDMGMYIKDFRSFSDEGGFLEEPTYVKVISDMIKEKNLAHARIGTELGYDELLGLPFPAYVRLTKSLPDAKFVDGSHIFRRLRMVKSPTEVGYIRKACDAGENGLKILWDTLKEEMTEWDAVKIFWSAATREGAKPAWHQVYSTGHGILEYTRFSADVPLKRGSLLSFDIGLTYGGYHCDFCRLAVIGKASPLQKKAAELNRTITKESIEAIKPGMKCSEAMDAILKVHKKAWKTAPPEIIRMSLDWVAHGIGLKMSETPMIASFDDTILEPGMTFAVEPITITNDFVINQEEDIVVTEEGCEILTKASTELREI